MHNTLVHYTLVLLTHRHFKLTVITILPSYYQVPIDLILQLGGLLPQFIIPGPHFREQQH